MRMKLKKCKNEEHCGKSECVYGKVRIKLESAKAVNTVCEVCVSGERSAWAL